VTVMCHWCAAQFFSPIEPLHIDIELTRAGRASGDAIVEFETGSDVKEALKRHRETIGRSTCCCQHSVFCTRVELCRAFCVNSVELCVAIIVCVFCQYKNDTIVACQLVVIV